MSGFFGVLQDSDSSSSDNERPRSDARTVPPPVPLQVAPPAQTTDLQVPSYEDLSTSRADEETVLQVVYAKDFRRVQGVWGCARLEVDVRPPDVDPEQIGSQLCLSVQLGKKYPYVVPAIEFRNVKGLSKEQQSQLHQQLMERATELAESGSVMMVELVQVCEDFLGAHNRDPNMSAWEQMKAREAEEKEKQRKVDEELNRLMDTSGNRGVVSPMASRTGVSFLGDGGDRDELSLNPPDLDHVSSTEVEREFLRQREALDEAKRVRMGRARSLSVNEEEPELTGAEADAEDFEFDDDDDDDYDQEHFGLSSASRYQSDFVELGVLGRGGGGEVVKVRNRLDRRVYAIKKILLESERGSYANYAAIQNRKLRREVTTISRMTHKNIVRYYQAWVEGGSDGAITEAPEEEAAALEAGTIDAKSAKLEDVEEESEESSESDGCWWTNSPNENHLLTHMEHRKTGGTGDVEDDLSSFGSSSTNGDEGGIYRDEGDGGDFDAVDFSASKGLSRTSDSMVNLLENENEYDFQSPLLTGLGFQNKAYDGLFDHKVPKSSKTSTQEDSTHSGDWDESSVKIGNGDGKAILYIQMEYCSTTLRKIIDEGEMINMEENEKWRLIRQLLEALVYIHSRDTIHRDLKPGNVFLDGDSNIRLGDFGLATRHRTKPGAEEEDEDTGSRTGIDDVYEAIGDIRRLLGEPAVSTTKNSMFSSCGESMTGGVGTTFYRAPEQEGKVAGSKSDSSYTVQADIFSFGIILFEMFHVPFPTYMERAETLTKLRGDTEKGDISENPIALSNDRFRQLASRRFPLSFLEATPENAQRIILWCLERDPKKRPSAEELLASDLLPRKIELEQRYLAEALELLTSSQSDSYFQILDALFNRPTPDVVDLTFDTDVAARANSAARAEEKTGHSPSEKLLQAISDIRAGAVDIASLRFLVMSSSSLAAATSALKRASHAGKVGRTGKGMLKRAAQRTAGIIAMRSATAAAVTGAMDGVLGSDPMVVDSVCEKIKQIFEVHGAARLRSPLLRPRPNVSGPTPLGGPAEVINPRGSVLLLPEDLTASFARSLGRGGSATSHLKRYDIGRVYHKSMVGGHPRESVEASFDIVHESTPRGDLLEAETIMVAAQAIKLLPAREINLFERIAVKSPIWYLRLGHTRLADAVLDVCGIPQNEVLRRGCFHILTRFTSAPPSSLNPKTKSRRGRKLEKASQVENLGVVLAEAVKLGMPKTAAEKFRKFIVCCLPVQSDISTSIESIRKALATLRSMEKTKVDPRKGKRFEDAARSLRSLRDLVKVLEVLGFIPLVNQEVTLSPEDDALRRPLYISLDLGLRQRRQNYHGGTIFQCIVLPDGFFEKPADPDEDHDSLISSSGVGTKISEGGNFSDLVRKNRPPGNFASVLLNSYTSAPIPVCAGVRFLIGRFVELVYLDAALVGRTDARNWKGNDGDNSSIDALRRSLCHPFPYSKSVSCVVASVNGMDAASTPERFFVAARLWSEGIAAEYLPQSNVMLSLVKRTTTESPHEASSDWSLLELNGVCALMNIPFIIIVQPHLLKDKGSVRVRQVFHSQSSTMSTNTSSNAEMFVSLDDLATIILGAAATVDATDDNTQSVSGVTSSTREQRPSRNPRPTTGVSVECIYVDNDQYFGNDREVLKSETHQWKTYMKSMKMTVMAAESYLGSLNDASSFASMGVQCVPVFAAADLSFWVMRDVGTAIMRRECDQSAIPACNEIIEKYGPQHKRSLKTLGTAVDNYMKRYGIWSNASQTPQRVRDGSPHETLSSRGSSLLPILLYSKVDDRFDMITLSCRKNSSAYRR